MRWPDRSKCQPNGAASTDPDYPGTLDAIKVTDAACGISSNCSGSHAGARRLGRRLLQPQWLARRTDDLRGWIQCTNGTQACNKSVVMGALKVTGGE